MNPFAARAFTALPKTLALIGLLAGLPGTAQSLVPPSERAFKTPDPKKSALAGLTEDDRLRKEQQDAQYLMDLQVREAEANAHTAAKSRDAQDRAATAMARMYEDLVEGQNRGLRNATTLLNQQSPVMTTPQMLEAGAARTMGNPPLGAPARTGSEMTRALDALAMEDGPEIARQKGLGFVPMGTIVDIRLLSAVNTAIPGPVIGVVVHDVFDVDMRLIVIPRGSKAIGVSSSMGSDTEARGKVSFTTFVDPSGRVVPIAIPVQSANRVGITGIDGSVNYHWGRIFGGSVALAVVTGLTGGSGTSPISPNASQGDLTRQNLLQSGGQLSQQLLQRFMQIKPDITLEEGSVCKVLLMQHIMARPYQQVW